LQKFFPGLPIVNFFKLTEDRSPARDWIAPGHQI
jgi:hypothetical protein